MVSKVIFVVLAAAAVAVMADERPVYSYDSASSEESSESSESYESTEAKYSFNWGVKDDSSSNEFGHQEDRDNDDTKGSYFVHLPDGRLQKVSYYVNGDSGYIADVTYEGEARYPDSYESESVESYESESVESSEEDSYEYARR